MTKITNDLAFKTIGIYRKWRIIGIFHFINMLIDFFFFYPEQLKNNL